MGNYINKYTHTNNNKLSGIEINSLERMKSQKCKGISVLKLGWKGGKDCTVLNSGGCPH